MHCRYSILLESQLDKVIHRYSNQYTFEADEATCSSNQNASAVVDTLERRGRRGKERERERERKCVRKK